MFCIFHPQKMLALLIKVFLLAEMISLALEKKVHVLG